jgi:tetratricopeptide (TPR) repeat protein
MSSLNAIAFSHNVRCWIYVAGDDRQRMLEESEAELEVADRAGDWVTVYWGLGNRALAESRLGNHETAVETLSRQKELGQRLGGQIIGDDFYAASRAEIALNAGRVEEALALAEQAVGVAQSIDALLAEGLARRVCGRALAALTPPRWDEAEAQLAESVRVHELGAGYLEAAHTRVAWGIVCRDRGNLSAARAHWEKAAAQFEASGLTAALDRTRALMAGLSKDRF